MGTRRQLIVSWGEEVLVTKSLDLRPIVIGDVQGTDVELPIRALTIPVAFEGTLTSGDFCVSVSTTHADDEIERPKRIMGPTRWTLASTLVHVGVLVMLAVSARLLPTDPHVEQRQHVEAMQGYLARVAEHDRELSGDVSSTVDMSTVVAGHDAQTGNASFESPFGDDGQGSGQGNQNANGSNPKTTGMHRDRTNPTDSELARALGDTTAGITATAHVGDGKGTGRSGTPSHLAPNLGNKTALADGKSAGVHGRVAQSHSGGGGGSGSGAGGASNPNSTWIEFELYDGNGGPVVGEPYRVTLPDGSIREGKTDAHGLVCFTGIPHGNAEIEWTGPLGKYAKYVGSGDKPI
jgi:hypothetical protein